MPPSEALGWRQEIASQTTPADRKYLLRIWISDYVTAIQKNPQEGLEIIKRLDAEVPHQNAIKGQVVAERGLFEMLCGRYAESSKTFDRLFKSKIGGFNFQAAASQARHADVCAGYHARRADAGITEPKEVDPLCGAASLAVIFRYLGKNYSKALLSTATAHTGFGSTLADIRDAAKKFGYDAYPVDSSLNGIRNLINLNGGIPVVTRVEHDHFIAVYGADSNGVTYLCSDCGDWPGGKRHVTWDQWKLMEPDAYLVVTEHGSDFSAAMASLPNPGTKDEFALQAMSITSESPLTERAMSIRALALQTQTAPILESYWVHCGQMYNNGQCNCDCGCPIMSFSQSATHDPVNVANGAEEYKSPSGISIYNPTGPSVYWNNSYSTLAHITPNGWGWGWYHPYLITVSLHEDPTGMTDMGARVILPNSSSFDIDLSGHTNPPSSGQTYTGGVQYGYPYIFQYKNVSGSLFLRLISESRTVYEFQKLDTSSVNSYDSQWYLSKIIDRTGHYITLDWVAKTFQEYNDVTRKFTGFGLSAIKDSSGSALLNLTYDPTITSRLNSVTDYNGRTIYYTHDYFTANRTGQFDTVDELSSVSTIDTGGGHTDLWVYDYDNEATGESGGGIVDLVPYLYSISTKDPDGSGMVAATIQYGDRGYVRSVTDANNNKIVFDYGGTTGRVGVQFQNSSSTVFAKYTIGTNSNMQWTDVWASTDDVTYNALSGESFVEGRWVDFPYVHRDFLSSSPFRPSAVTLNYDQPAHANPPVTPTQKVWNYTWDVRNHLTTATSPKGIVTTITRDFTNFALGEVTEVETDGKTSTQYEYYEPEGLVQYIHAPIPGDTHGSSSRQDTTLTYNSYGDLATVTSPGNNAGSTKTVTLGYGGSPQKGEPLTVTDPNSNVTTYTYTGNGHVQNVTDAESNQTDLSYDAADRLVSVTYPSVGGNVSHSQNVYLYLGGPLSAAEMQNSSNSVLQQVDYTYGHEGELLSVTGDTLEQAYTYDAYYRLKTITDGESNVTTYNYDANGRVTDIQLPGHSSTNYDQVHYTSYDRQGNLLTKTDGVGQVVTYGYGDDDGLMDSVSYTGASSQNIGITYDDYDRVTGVTDAEGSNSASYDDLNHVMSASRTYTGISAKTFDYSYYPDGSREEMSTPAGDWDYLYDIGGRCTSMTSPAGTSTNDYFDNNWISRRTLPNGTYTDYTYNAVGLPTAVTSKNSSNTTLNSFGSFSYDGVFRMTGLTASYPGATTFSGATTWTYDDKNELTQEASTRYSGWTHNNAFDDAGNPTTFKGNTRAYNGDNQLTTGSPTYDGNGNPSATLGGQSLSYDVENRVTAVGSQLTCGYRADGLRAWKQGSTGGKTYFLYDGGNPVIEMNSSGTVLNINVFAPDGLVGRKESTTWSYYTFDQQGNVSQRLDASQNVVTSRVFDAWGSGAETTTPRSIDCWNYNARWGYYNDRETGLYLCQHRMLDSTTGRWINRDPIGYAGGINLYGYCGGGPVGVMDPLGTLVRNYWPDEPGYYLSDPIYHESGRDVIDSNGNHVRIGGWPMVFNLPGNAETINGTTHLWSEHDWNDYSHNKWWQNHEGYHNVQQEDYCGGSAIVFFVCICAQYSRNLGHSDTPFEREADAYADSENNPRGNIPGFYVGSGGPVGIGEPRVPAADPNPVQGGGRGVSLLP